MHKILRQLINQKLENNPYDRDLQGLFDTLSDTFYQFDEEKLALEQSLNLTSEELNAINQQLRSQLQEVKNYQDEIEISYSKQKALLDSSREAVFTFKANGEMDEFNKSACKLLGLTRNEISQRSFSSNLKLFLSHLKSSEKMLHIFRKMSHQNLEIFKGYVETNNGKHYEYFSIPELIEDKYIGRAWSFRDITYLRKQQIQLTYQANHDSLTSLPNRAFIISSLKQALKSAKRKNKNIAVLFIDLDDFKKINDTIGHKEGDKFLIYISENIRKSIREIDILGRLGGDEFIIIAEDFESKAEIEYIYNRILGLFKHAFPIKGNEYNISCSIGISIFPRDGQNPEELIRKADMAMYEAKRKGKDNVHFYDAVLEKNILYQVSTEARLAQALKNKDFVIHYQPKVNLLTGEIAGIEALVRWQQADGQLIYPSEFIPFAESVGIISKITELVANMVFDQIDRWKGSTMEAIPVSLNISATDFSNEIFFNKLLDLMERRITKPGSIEIEITETALFDDINYVKNSLSALKKHHIKISVDDFGTGHSSLSYLQYIKVDHLKIDKSFVSGIQDSFESRAIVKSIIDIGLNLGISVIAEGIESEFQRNFLRRNGCTLGQGHYFSKALPAENIIFELPLNRYLY